MDPFFLLLIAAFVVGLSKGGLASAAAVTVPMLALVMSPVAAAALLLPVYLVTDVVGVWLYRRDWSARNLAILVPSMLLGVVMAVLLVPILPEAALLLLTGGVGLWYLARSWLAGPLAAPTAATVPWGVFWGTLAGITSFVTHSGAPPAQAYLLPQRLPRLRLAGTITIAFAIGNLAKLPGYWAIGLLAELDWTLTVQLIAAGIAGTAAGRQVVKVLNDETYRRILEVVLLALSILLVARGVAGLA